jgi:Putative porin
LKKTVYIFLALCGILLVHHSFSQEPTIRRPTTAQGGSVTRGVTDSRQQGGDSLKHRTGLEDSITIRFRYLDSSKLVSFDSIIYDFSSRLHIPPHYYYLGNLGNAANDWMFSPYMKAGWDAGFHSYDLYRIRMEEVKFYNTTRPYSELGYLLGSKAEQVIHLLHTQNIKPNWNVAFQYRMINSPGFVQNQNTNHNSYRINSWYQSNNKRYSNFFVVLANNLQSAENGGIESDKLLDSAAFQNRIGIPVKLGEEQVGSTNFFSTNIPTGTKYRDLSLFLRQQYDIGQKDSLVVNDTTVVPLFYPRLRFEYNLKFSSYRYRFEDAHPDSAYYAKYYGLDTSQFYHTQDLWRELLNDFSIYTFPDKKNPQQFLKLGASIQNLSGTFDTSDASSSWEEKYYNFFGHAEYRNKSRNQKWDIEAFGNLYFAGLNSGDYDAYISLRRLVSKKLGYFQLGFQNTNRSPSYLFNPTSSFWKETTTRSFNKENTIVLFAAIEEPKIGLRLNAQYYLVSNYLFFKGMNERAQESGIFNVLKIGAEKMFNLGRRWKWRTWVTLQQKAGSSPIQIPLFYTRNIIGYEGNLGFPNLNIAFGTEIKYHTNYKANGYSPLMGQFYLQDTLTITRNFPQIDAYVHFRIRSFTAYFRAENLNTLQFSGSNSGFTRNNLVAPDYPSPGLVIRLGIFWSFVN